MADDTYWFVRLKPGDMRPMPANLRRSILSAGQIVADSVPSMDKPLFKLLEPMFIANVLLDTPFKIGLIEGAPQAGYFLNRFCSYVETRPKNRRSQKTQSKLQASPAPTRTAMEKTFASDWPVAAAIWPLRLFIHAAWRGEVDLDSAICEMNYLCRLTVTALVRPEPVDYSTARRELEERGKTRHEAARRRRPHQQHGELADEIFLRRARILDAYQPAGSPEGALKYVIRTAINAIKDLPIEIGGKKYSASAIRRRRDKTLAEAARQVDESNEYARKHRHRDTVTAGQLVEEITGRYNVSATTVYARIRLLRAEGKLDAFKASDREANQFGLDDVARIRAAFASELLLEEVLVTEHATEIARELGVGRRRAIGYVRDAARTERVALRETTRGLAMPNADTAARLTSWIRRQRLR